MKFDVVQNHARDSDEDNWDNKHDVNDIVAEFKPSFHERNRNLVSNDPGNDDYGVYQDGDPNPESDPSKELLVYYLPCDTLFVEADELVDAESDNEDERENTHEGSELKR